MRVSAVKLEAHCLIAVRLPLATCAWKAPNFLPKWFRTLISILNGTTQANIPVDINSNEWRKKRIEQTWQFRNGTGLLKGAQTEESAFGYEITDKQAQKGEREFCEGRDISNHVYLTPLRWVPLHCLILTCTTAVISNQRWDLRCPGLPTGTIFSFHVKGPLV